MTNTSVFRTKDANLRHPLRRNLDWYQRPTSDAIEYWGLSFQYYLGRALKYIISAGRHRSEINDICNALTWLKRAQTKPSWKIKFDQALEDWPIDDDLVLALEYILCAANVKGALDHIESAIRCLENRLTYLKEQEIKQLNFDEDQANDLERCIRFSDYDRREK